MRMAYNYKFLNACNQSTGFCIIYNNPWYNGVSFESKVSFKNYGEPHPSNPEEDILIIFSEPFRPPNMYISHDNALNCFDSLYGYPETNPGTSLNISPSGFIPLQTNECRDVPFKFTPRNLPPGPIYVGIRAYLRHDGPERTPIASEDWTYRAVSEYESDADDEGVVLEVTLPILTDSFRVDYRDFEFYVNGNIAEDRSLEGVEGDIVTFKVLTDIAEGTNTIECVAGYKLWDRPFSTISPETEISIEMGDWEWNGSYYTDHILLRGFVNSLKPETTNISNLSVYIDNQKIPVKRLKINKTINNISVEATSLNIKAYTGQTLRVETEAGMIYEDKITYVSRNYTSKGCTVVLRSEPPSLEEILNRSVGLNYREWDGIGVYSGLENYNNLRAILARCGLEVHPSSIQIPGWPYREYVNGNAKEQFDSILSLGGWVATMYEGKVLIRNTNGHDTVDINGFPTISLEYEEDSAGVINHLKYYRQWDAGGTYLEREYEDLESINGWELGNGDMHPGLGRIVMEIPAGGDVDTDTLMESHKKVTKPVMSMNAEFSGWIGLEPGCVFTDAIYGEDFLITAVRISFDSQGAITQITASNTDSGHLVEVRGFGVLYGKGGNLQPKEGWIYGRRE